jgi:hypothetical protein
MIRKTHASCRELRTQGLRARVAQRGLAHFYGLFAVLVVASVQIFFSLQQGGYNTAQWYWGVGAIMAAVFGAALVPGYLSSPSVGRKQWALAGALLLLVVVVSASIFWSIAPTLSILEASRTTMYVGAFVLLLPAVARWGSLMVDATIFGALLPPAIYGLLQKAFPTSVEYTGRYGVEVDPTISSTVGYTAAFGMMCAMGVLLAVARIGSFCSVLLRALYSVTGVLFLVALYFSFSRGALLALAVGVIVLLVLAQRRFEVLCNLAIAALPALWVVSQARDYPALVSRPVSLEVIETDGLALLGILALALLFALVAQALFTVLVGWFVRVIPEGTHGVLRIAGTVSAVVIVVVGLYLGWSAFQQAGGFDELKNQIMDTPSQSQAQAITADQTERFSSLNTNRIEQWKIAWENWREHPFTGTGGDTYQIVHEEKAPLDLEGVLHPHSVWMSLLSDTGIFAFLSFAAFCIGCLAIACYSAFSGTVSGRSRALLAGSTAAISAYLVSSSIDWHWYIPGSTLPFFALAAVAVSTTGRQRELSANQDRVRKIQDG